MRINNRRNPYRMSRANKIQMTAGYAGWNLCILVVLGRCHSLWWTVSKNNEP